MANTVAVIPGLPGASLPCGQQLRKSERRSTRGRITLQPSRHDQRREALGGPEIIAGGLPVAVCHQCGEECTESAQVREYGLDEIGYHDYEVLCPSCGR